MTPNICAILKLQRVKRVNEHAIFKDKERA